MKENKIKIVLVSELLPVKCKISQPRVMKDFDDYYDYLTQLELEFPEFIRED